MVLNVGDSKSLTATVQPVGAPQAVVWTYSANSAANVSASGVVFGRKAGTTNITATAANGVSSICTVTVKEVTP